jgi:hypothetical protein
MPPAAAAHWPTVLAHAQRIVDEHGGSITRPALWAALVAGGLAPAHGEHGFRAALRDAQNRCEFPPLPRAKPGPAKGSAQRGGSEGTGHGALVLRTLANGLTYWFADWSEGGEQRWERLGLADSFNGLTRDEAEAALRERVERQTPWELYSERLKECENLLRSIAGIKTVRLSPSTYRVLAEQGWGEDIVMHAARLLVAAGLAEMHWEVSGVDAWPVVEAVAG